MHRASRTHRGPWWAFALSLPVLLASAFLACAAEPEPQLVSIDTGGKTGVYYFAGGAICGFVNAGRWTHGIRCLSESTNGSIENLHAVRSGRASFGLVQSDWQYNAVGGTSVFEAVGPDRELRSVFSLFPEPLTVVANPDAGIVRLEDLLGKRVNLGPSGSGGRGTMNVVMGAMGWEDADFAYVSDLPMDALSEAICSGEIDAAVFIVAHPNLTVDEMISNCNAHLVPVEDPAIDELIGSHRYYVESEIPAGTYPGQQASIPVFAIRATLVTSARVSPTVVETLVRSVFDNLENLREAHPAFADLDPEKMVTNGLTAPLHDGARRYYESVGLLPGPEPGG